jgi:hypothetical protein
MHTYLLFTPKHNTFAHVLCTNFYLRPSRIKKNLIYFRQFHYTTQWNNDLHIPLSGAMKLTYPTEWSNEMRPVMKFFIPLK